MLSQEERTEIVRFLTDLDLYHREYQLSASATSGCDGKLLPYWECCEAHRKLKAMYEEISIRAVHLNEKYALGGLPFTPHLVLLNSEEVEEHYRKTVILSSQWIEDLERKLELVVS